MYAYKTTISASSGSHIMSNTKNGVCTETPDLKIQAFF